MAAERSDVLSLFEALDGLAALAMSLRAEGKAQKKQTQETFLRQWDEVLAKFLQYRNAGFEPARIFYQRMADSQTVICGDHHGEYSFAIEMYRSFVGKKRSPDLLGMATALLTYCNTHRLDPDNSLIGLSPSLRALQSCTEEERTAKKRSAMAEGDLLLVEVTTDQESEARWQYVRVARSASEGDDLVAVYMLPEEKSREEVSVRSVRPVSSWILQNLGQAKSMQRLVCDPFETFVQRLQDDVKSATHAFLASQHLDVELLEDVVNKPNEAPPLSALPRLRQLIAGLLTLNSRLDLLSAFYDDVNAAADRKIEAFLADIENQRVFLPMKAANLTHLETFNFSSFATNRIRMCYGRCDACMDTMKLALKDLTNGQAKQRLTQWWLEKIETETTAFLRSKKYAFDAYPSEYLQAPPENIQPVKFNLQLIREILNPLDDKHGTQELVARLKGEIYPRIDEFILSALVTLNQVLPTVPTSSPAPDVAELEALVATAAVVKQDAERLQWMTELVKDLKYLARMRQLETSGERVLDVVPISGLVLSQFYRLENELKTVIELWDAYLQEQAQMKGGKTYQRLKTKIYLWKISDPNKIDIMKEFGGTSCIMQIETGGFFSAALTEHGEVYAWGKGLSGELGIGEKKHSDEPVQVEALKGKKVIQISCGGAACAAVTSDGELYLWGFFVVLGAPLLTPTVVDAAQFNHVRIREVSMGPQHMLVLLDSGELYVWGKGNRGQLGLGQLKDRATPSLLEGDLRSRKIKRVRAGEDISAAVTEAGELYVWGKNDDLLLGIDSAERSVDRPTRLTQLSGRVADVAVGSRHLVALTEAGEVFTWGSSLRPALVDNLPSRPLMIACGQQHSVVCTETDVVTWKFARTLSSTEDSNAGSQRKINLSEKDKKSQRAPEPAKLFPKRDLELIEELHGKHVLQVACGSQHTTVLVENPAFFGVPLTTVMEREKGRRVPSMVQKICAYLLNRIATEGLFRFAGRAAQVQELRNDFDRDEDVNLFRCRDPHTVTSLLKDYLRLLPEPLIPYDHVDAFLSLGDPGVSAPARASEAAKFSLLSDLVNDLPGSHRELLEYLLVFWNKVASRFDENKMNAQALAIALAPVVFRRKDGEPSGLTKEAAILAANTVLRWLITWGRAYAEETPESLMQQAHLWATKPQVRADVWQLWALRISKEAASQSLSPSVASFTMTLLSSSALDAALASAVTHDIDATEAQSLNLLCCGLLRTSDSSLPQHIEALEQKAREAQARVASSRSVSEERLEEFVAEEAMKARNAAGLVTARLALFTALTRQASRLRALGHWAQSSQALSVFRAHRWPLESGWRLLEAAGAEVAPLLLRGFNASELAVQLSVASSREIDAAQASITAAEAFVEIRRTQLGQLSFARKKLQSAQQAGNASAVQSLNSKLVLMRDAFVSPADSHAMAPGVLLAPLSTCMIPTVLEQRRTSLFTAASKLESALSELKSKP